MNYRPYIQRVILDTPIDEQSYVYSLPAVSYLRRHGSLPFDKAVTFLVGENGTGKSTLIEAIAVAYGFNPEGGSRNFNFSTRQSHSDLYQHLTLERSAYAKDGFFLRAESLYNVASSIEEMDRLPAPSSPIIGSYGGVSLHEQSHGESFLALVQKRFRGNGLYILDEPEAALSPMRLLTLMIEMDRLVKCHSQFIIATHSPLLMAFPGATVYELSADGIQTVDYRATEHFLITKRFLNDPDSLLHDLLHEKDG